MEGTIRAVLLRAQEETIFRRQASEWSFGGQAEEGDVDWDFGTWRLAQRPRALYPEVDGRQTPERVCVNTHTDLASEERGESEEG